MSIRQILFFLIIPFFLIKASALSAGVNFIFNKNSGDFRIVYQTQTILEGELKVEVNGVIHSLAGINARINYHEHPGSGPNDGIIRIGSFEIEAPENGSLVFQGIIQGKDAFPANPQAKNTRLIRTVSGFSGNLLNSGIYSRKNDWALLFDGAEERFFEFIKSIDEIDVFETRVKGRTFRVLFKPDYYRTHMGLAFFNPAEFDIYTGQPMGWISWKAYQATVTEQDIRKAADWCALNLRQFGLNHIILDDGWFVGSKGSALYHSPEDVDWTKGNERFPSGMRALSDYIHQKGFKAGIWLSPFGISNEDLMAEHPDWWVRQSEDGPWATSNIGWHGPYFADGSIDSALSGWIMNGITAMDKAGYDFFKIDGQMHVAHEAYEQGSEYFASNGMTWQQAYRHAWKAIMDSVSGKFVLSCWSRIPENIGNTHAIRIGGDKDAGWEYGSGGAADDLAKFLYEHNICWICDPDHIVLGGCSLAESRSWVSLVGLTGAMFTFSDIPRDLTGEKVEMYRKILPTIITRPLELYGMSSTPPLWCLEVNRDYDNWLVVANTSFGSDVVKRIDFAELGLDPSAEYVVYDFWNKDLVGVFKNSFFCGPPGEHDADVYSIRKKRDYPWVVSVDRHISQGGVSLIDLSYDDSAQTLSGTSRVVPDHDYNINIYKPEGFHVDRISVNTGDYDIDPSRPGLINLNLKSADRELIDWQISFRK